MQLSEDETFKNYAEHCGHCGTNLLLPYEYEFICISCGYNVIKRKHGPSKNQRKKTLMIH